MALIAEALRYVLFNLPLQLAFIISPSLLTLYDTYSVATNGFSSTGNNYIVGARIVGTC